MGLEVEIVGERLECSVDGQPRWSTPIDAIVLIAEYTTNEGPWCDDYYLAIKFMERGRLMDARIDNGVVGGLETLLRGLRGPQNAELTLQLVSITEWNSRVMWPKSIEGEKFFTLDPIAPAGIWATIKKWCFGPSLSLALTQPVQDYLRQYETKADVVCDDDVGGSK